MVTLFVERVGGLLEHLFCRCLQIRFHGQQLMQFSLCHADTSTDLSKNDTSRQAANQLVHRNQGGVKGALRKTAIYSERPSSLARSTRSHNAARNVNHLFCGKRRRENTD